MLRIYHVYFHYNKTQTDLNKLRVPPSGPKFLSNSLSVLLRFQNQQRKMTHQRKQNLKSLMLNKAREDLKREAEVKAEEKKKILNSRIEPLSNLGGMSEQDLKV